MTDDKRAELTRLAKVAWPEHGEFAVRTGDDCFDFHDGIELDGLIEHGGYVRIGIYKHPRADDAMLAALRVLANEEAGFAGDSYERAREMAKTQAERIAELEKELAEARSALIEAENSEQTAVAKLRQAYLELTGGAYDEIVRVKGELSAKDAEIARLNEELVHLIGLALAADEFCAALLHERRAKDAEIARLKALKAGCLTLLRAVAVGDNKVVCPPAIYPAVKEIYTALLNLTANGGGDADG